MPAQAFPLPYPDGGLNETFPAHLIGDNQLTLMDNYYYNTGGKLVSRPGTEWITRFSNGEIYGIGSLPNVGRAIAIQSGSILYGRSDYIGGGSSFVSLKTGVASGPRYFAVMNSCLYSGTIQGTSTADNLKWDPTGSAAVTIPGTPPALSYLCVWNSRMWGVHRTSKTKLYFSKVGDPDDWTTTGISGAGFIDIGYSDGEEITGLVVHNEQLFILKERSIWHIVTANPNTDNSAWRVEYVSKQYGCTSHDGILTLGNDVLIPTSCGYTSMNVALYQGDFKMANASVPINYHAAGFACHVRTTNQALYCEPWSNSTQAYALDKAGNNIRWMGLTIFDPAGTQRSIVRVAGDYSPINTFGNFYPGPYARGQYSLIVATTGILNTYDILQYPTTKQGAEGHYDYIGGPSGASTIHKKLKSKMFHFGSFGYDKRSTFAVFTCRKNNREEVVEADETTLSTIFDGDIAGAKQDKIITDVSADAATAGNTSGAVGNTFYARSSVRTAVIGIGGTEGRIYKGIQFQLENNIGGYELEYGEIEMDVEKIGKFPRPSDKVLA